MDFCFNNALRHVFLPVTLDYIQKIRHYCIGFMLPDTFGTVVDGLGQWTALQSGTTNLTYFKDMLDAFVDIIWNRLIMGGLNENAVLLIVFVFIFMILSANSAPLYDENAEKAFPRS